MSRWNTTWSSNAHAHWEKGPSTSMAAVTKELPVIAVWRRSSCLLQVFWLRGLLAAAILLLTACGGAPSRTAQPHEVGPGRTGFWWIVGSSTLRGVEAAGGTAAARAAFDTPHTFIAGAAGVPSGWTSMSVTSFTSEVALASALENGSVHTRAVLLDLEDWPLTPVVEQKDPAGFESEASSLAHAHHLLFIATPAVDLVRVLGRNPGETAQEAYLRLDIAGTAALHADAIDIQAQALEQNLPLFTSFVREAASQARAAHPGVIVLAGISTNHSGVRASPDQLLAAVQATRPYVDGYWLNDPRGGRACPRCTGPYPSVALQFLSELEQQNAAPGTTASSPSA